MNCKKCGKCIPEQMGYCPSCKINEIRGTTETKEAEQLKTKATMNIAMRLIIRIVIFVALLFPCFVICAFVASLISDCTGEDWSCGLGNAGYGLIFSPFLSLGIIFLFSKKTRMKTTISDNR